MRKSAYHIIVTTVVTTILVALAVTPIHEWGHYQAAKSCGYDGKVTYDTPISGGYSRYGNGEASLGSDYDWFISLMGGMTVFIFCLLSMLLIWDREWSATLVFALFGVSNFIYAFIEMARS